MTKPFHIKAKTQHNYILTKNPRTQLNLEKCVLMICATRVLFTSYLIALLNPAGDMRSPNY